MIKTISKLVIKTLALLLLIVTVLLALFLTTEPGLQISYDYAKKHMPGNFSIGELHGSLLGPIIATDIRYQYSGTIYSIHKLYFNWHAWGLFDKEIIINKFHAQGVSFNMDHTYFSNKPSSSKPYHAENVIPLPIKIHNLQLKDISYEYDKNKKPMTMALFTAKGTVLPNQQLLSAQLSGLWENYRLPLSEKQQLHIATASYEVTGTPLNYHFTLNHTFNSTGLPTSHWHIKAKGNLKGISFYDMQGKLLAGHLSGRSDINWYQHFSWQALFNLHNLNPAVRWPKWPGKMQAALSSQGSVKDDKLQADITIHKISGLLKNHPVSGSSKLYFSNDKFIIEPTKLQLGKANLTFDAKYDKHWQAQWQIFLPHLSSLYAASHGALTTSGSFIGDTIHPTIKAKFTIDNFSYQKANAKKINGDIDYKASHSNLHLTAQHMTYDKIALQNLQLNATGNQQQNMISLTTLNKNLYLQMELRGAMVNHSWQGKLSKLNLTSDYYNNWHLQTSPAITISADKFSIESFCWLNNRQGKACVGGQWLKNQSWQAALTIHQLKLDKVTQQFSNDMILNSKLNAKINIDAKAGQAMSATANVTMTPGTFSYPIGNGNHYQVPIQGATIDAAVNQQGLKASASLAALKQQLLFATLSLPSFNGQQAIKNADPIKATLKLNLSKLQFLQAFLPKLKNTKGEFSAQFNADGTIQTPNIKGYAKLDNGSFRIPNIGVTVKKIHLHATTDNARDLHFKGQATLGKGNVLLTGDANIFNDGKATLNIKGDNLTVYNTREIQVYATPDLTFDYYKNRLNLIGTVTIPKAQIAPKDFSNTVTMPSDTVYIRPDDVAKSNPILFYSDIVLQLGKDIHVDYKGFKAQLLGKIEIKDAPQKATTGNGELRVVNGSYKAYGQDLTIQNGRLLFAGGPINNPGINVEATRDVKVFSTPFGSNTDSSTSSATLIAQKTVVGVRIIGTLDEPSVSLFSRPSTLSQTDILSYLVLGYPINQASATDGNTLADAASALSLASSQFTNINQTLKDTFGLSELTIGNESDYDPDQGTVVQNTSLVLGKYLTPKLYLNYSIGLSEPINTLRVRYSFNQNWSVQSETNIDASGADVFYTVKKN